MLDQTDPAEAGRHGRRAAAHAPGSRRDAGRAAGGDAQPVDARARRRVERHARLILTAGAAARIPVSAELAADAANLIASMLSAGMDRAGGALGRRWSRQAARAIAPGRCSRSARRGRPVASTPAGSRPSSAPTTARAGGAVAAAGRGARRARPDRRRARPAPAGVAARRRATAGRRRSTRRRASARAGHGRPARRGRHADRRLVGRAAALSVPDRPRAARGRPGVRGPDDRRRGAWRGCDRRGRGPASASPPSSK